MGLTDRQLLWRVELPLALPEIIAGLRIAATTTVGPGDARRSSRAPAASASEIFAGATSRSSRTWSWPAASPCCWPLALDVILLGVQRAADAVAEGEAGMIASDARVPRRVRRRDRLHLPHARGADRRRRRSAACTRCSSFTLGAPEAERARRWRSPARSRSRSGSCSATSGKGELLAISVSNVGRAVPSLALIAFFVAYLGVGFTNVMLALVLLAIPPILTNTYVGVRQVDRDMIDAGARHGPDAAAGDRAPDRAAARAPAASSAASAPRRSTWSPPPRSRRSPACSRSATPSSSAQRLRRGRAARGRDPGRRCWRCRRRARLRAVQRAVTPEGPEDRVDAAVDGRRQLQPAHERERSQPDETQRRPGPARAIAAARLRASLVAACGGDNNDSSRRARATAGGEADHRRTPPTRDVTITVGSKNFTEEFILGEIYAQALQAAGYKVKKDLNLGSEQIALQGAQERQHRRLSRVHGHGADVVLRREGDRTSRATRSRQSIEAKADFAKVGPDRVRARRRSRARTRSAC